MRIYTESGSSYELFTANGGLWFVFGRKEIKVTDLTNLEVGKKLTVEGYPLDLYCRPQSSKYTITTSPIQRIEE